MVQAPAPRLQAPRAPCRATLLSRSGGGTDVRLDVGVPFRAKAWPRAGISPAAWSWRIVVGFPWQTHRAEHINLLELRAVLSTYRWRLRRPSAVGTRFLHLVDSQVVASILAKGRSGSWALRATLRRINAVMLVGNLYPIVAYVHSEDNPADIPSRRGFRRAMESVVCRRRKAKGRAVASGCRHSEGPRQVRIQARKGKTLKSLLVSEKTVGRYFTAIGRFLQHRKVMGLPITGVVQLDEVASEYIEACWAEGEPMQQCSDLLAGLQWQFPHCHGHLWHTWKLVKCWAKVEPPFRAPPITPLIVLALAGLCWAVNWYDMAALLCVGFDAFLRSGELFTLRRRQIAFRGGCAIVQLPQTKGGIRRGLMEVVVVDSPLAVSLLSTACRSFRDDDTVARVDGAGLRKRLKALSKPLGSSTLVCSGTL